MTELPAQADRALPARSAYSTVERAKPGLAAYWPQIAYALLCALAFLTLVPIVWMVLTAFKSGGEVLAQPPTWFPREWHPENFQAAWEFAPFGRYLLNTAFMAGTVMVLEVLTSALAA